MSTGPFNPIPTDNIPPPPDGSGVVPVQRAASPVAQLPPPPDGSGVAPGDGTETVSGFSDELPQQPATQMAPEDVAHVQDMVAGGAGGDEVRAYLHSKGFGDAGNTVDQAVAYAKAHPGYRPGHIDKLAPAPYGDDGRAFARGMAQGSTLGTSDEIHGFLNGVGSLLHGGTYSGAYNRTVDADRAQLGYDNQNHYGQSLAGNIAGGLLLPAGLEKSGLTASMEGIALRAGEDAIASGATPEAAKVIAARAVARRMAAEGGVYGAGYGAGSAEGGPGQRLIGGATGAVEGAVAGTVANLAGKALAPAYNKAVGGINAISDQVGNVADTFTRAGAQRRAGSLLRDAAVDPDAALASIENAPAPASGASPTLAEVALDPGIAGFQRGHANTDLATAAVVGDRHAQNAIARTKTASDAMGEGTAQSVQDYASGQLSKAEAQTVAQQTARQAAIESRLGGVRATASGARSEAEQAQGVAREALGSVADRDASGAAARDAYEQAYDAAKAKTRAAYSDPALTTPTPVNIPKPVFMRLRQAADEFYGDGGGEIPPRLQSVLSDMADPHATTRTLTNIDRRLADFAGEAAMSGRRAEAAFAQRVRGDLGDFVQKSASPEYRAALANAKAARVDQGQRFETGSFASAFARDRYGNPTTGDNTLPSKLVRPGAVGGDTADAMTAAMGPETSEQIIRQELRRTADGGNVQSAADAEALRQRYGEAARRFPTVQRDLDALQAHGANLDAARQAETAAMRASATADELAGLKERAKLHETILASPLSKAADPETDPTSFVGQLLRRDDNGRRLQALYRAVSPNPDASNGFRRALGDYIVQTGKGPNVTSTGDAIPAVNKTREAIATVVSRAGDALNGQQKMVLKMVARELEGANFAATASKPAGSETAINKTYVDLLQHIPAPGFVASRSKMLVGKVLSVMSNGDEVKKLITQAILDPEFAATLLKRPTPKHWLQVRGGLMGRKVTTTLTLAGEPAAQTRVLSAAPFLPGRAAAQDSQERKVVQRQRAQQQPPAQSAQP